jgi:hypothetical protein
LQNSLGKDRVEKLVFIKTNVPFLGAEAVSDRDDNEDEDGVEELAVNNGVVDFILLE